MQASCHGTDNAAMVDARERGGGRCAGVAMIDEEMSGLVRLEHPSGWFDVILEVTASQVGRLGIVRTARKLMDGVVYPRAH